MARVLIYVQHLLGIGHLQRSLHIAGALSRRGAAVHLASGGMPVRLMLPDDVRLHQLPALKAGPGGFRDLRDRDDDPASAALWSARIKQLNGLMRQLTPDVLVIEAFPFGRWQMRDEIDALLQLAHHTNPRPFIVSSIRDILQISNKPGRAERTLKAVRQYFDAVLVHGDPTLARLEDSFPQAEEISDRLYYSGIVAGPTGIANAQAAREVIVSAGGGAVGQDLLRTALAARSRGALADLRWRLITGPNIPAGAFDELKKSTPDGLVVERFRPDFRARLKTAALSISQAGYNTTADVLQAGVPAVLVAYTGGGKESEQRMRAERLHSLGLAVSLDDETLTLSAMTAAIEAARKMGSEPPTRKIDLNGAEKSAELIIKWAELTHSSKLTSGRQA